MLRFPMPLVLALALAAVPAAAAEKSATISLRHLSAVELEETLAFEWVHYPHEEQMARFYRYQPLPILVPKGITTWAANFRKNTLTVTGSAAAVTELKHLIGKLDVPPRRLKL